MHWQEEEFEQIANRNFDVFVIGGGINGAVSAAALAGHGYSVCVVDKDDFASYTSQESSCLVWGGIKYMQNFEFGLVRKLCKSRNKLMRAYPSSIKEIRFFYPRSRQNKYPLLMLMFGSLFYWFIGSFFTKPPRLFSRKAIQEEEPKLNAGRFTGAVHYSDAYLPDGDARFVLRFILEAVGNSARAVNYTECVETIWQAEEKNWKIRLRNRINGKEITLTAGAVVNAGGPFVDRNNEANHVQTGHRHIFSKGVHLIVPRIPRRKRVITLYSDDKRMFFILPMGNKSCLGTTDTMVEQLPAKVTDEDRQFILDQINARLTLDKPLTKADIISERCGVRPLVISDAGQKAIAEGKGWTSLSRKHVIEQNNDRRYISIYGGKLTDCLNIGDEVVDIVSDDFKIKGASANPDEDWFGEPPKEERTEFLTYADQIQLNQRFGKGFSEKLTSRLWRRYGRAAWDLAKKIEQDPREGEEIIPGSETLRAEVTHSARWERNTNLEDFLRRRTLIAMLISREELTGKYRDNLAEISETLFGSEAAPAKLEEFLAAG